mgnify:CR=1 FL=1
MLDINEILNRLYEKMGVSKDSEFCKKMDLKASTVSSWRKRNSIPYDMIVDLSHNANFSIDYVIKGVENKNVENINYKEELLKTIENLKNEDIQCLYHIAKSKELRKKH